MVASAYAAISVISYFACWEVDHSALGLPPLDADGLRTENWGGKLGNALASLLVREWFGVAAVCIPLIGAAVALRLLRVGRLHTTRVCTTLLFFMLLTSLLLGIADGEQATLGAGLGGAHGHFVGHQWLTPATGIFGSAALLVVGYALLLSYAGAHRYARRVAAQLFSKKEKQPLAAALKSPRSRSKSAVKQPTATAGEAPAEGSPNDTPTTAEAPPHGQLDGGDIPFSVEEGEEDGGEPEVSLTEAPVAEEAPVDAVQPSLLPYDPKADLSRYELPTLDLLNDYPKSAKSVPTEELEANKNKIVRTLGHYSISISEIKATIGPTVTLYEIVPAPGVRISKIKGLENDIALSLAALGIRIIAPIPGKGTIGIEVPNQHPEIVSMHSVIRSAEFNDAKFELPIVLGKTITNKTFVLDLARMPHLLIAGATGQGKSVGMNAVLTSLLYKMHPSQLKLVLIDPKQVEFSLYSKIEKHFLAKIADSDESVITDTQKVIYALNSLCIEMEARYTLLKEAEVRNIKEYNQKFVDRRLNPEKGHRYLPYFVVVIDEFGDLIMTAGREIETPMARLAQKARAVGIHLVIATQRPATNIITGNIKANFPARIAFRVTQMVDSRTILDQSGAQHLIGKGDMLVSTGSDMVRVQCAFVDTPEVERIVEFIGRQQGYPFVFDLPEYVPEGGEGRDLSEVDLSKRDGKFEEAARLIVEAQQGSTSLIQRRLDLGYNRAGRIMDQLEAAGIVGPQQGSKPRDVRVLDLTALEPLLNR
jgi:S-DNA-T family DNA segregation ATPase FtsK/SpoIIIE